MTASANYRSNSANYQLTVPVTASTNGLVNTGRLW